MRRLVVAAVLALWAGSGCEQKPPPKDPGRPDGVPPHLYNRPPPQKGGPNK